MLIWYDSTLFNQRQKSKSVKGKILLITILMIVLVSVQKHLCKLWISLQFCILTNEFSQIEEVWKSHNDLLKKEVWVQWIQPGLCLSLNIWKHCFLPEKRQALACRTHPQPLFVSHHDELHCASISPTRPQAWSGGKSAFFTSFQVIFMQFKVWELLLERFGKKTLSVRANMLLGWCVMSPGAQVWQKHR